MLQRQLVFEVSAESSRLQSIQARLTKTYAQCKIPALIIAQRDCALDVSAFVVYYVYTSWCGYIAAVSISSLYALCRKCPSHLVRPARFVLPRPWLARLVLAAPVWLARLVLVVCALCVCGCVFRLCCGPCVLLCRCDD